MATYITGMTDVKNFKEFWPEVSNMFKLDHLDSYIKQYIRRAETLINSGASYDESRPNFEDSLNLAANLLIKRLILADRHPASSAEPAGVGSENAKGVSYSLKSLGKDKTRPLADIIGAEVSIILNGLSSSMGISTVHTTHVFDQPLLSYTVDGNTIELFDLSLDDQLYPSIAEQWRIRRIPAPFARIDSMYGPFGEPGD